MGEEAAALDEEARGGGEENDPAGVGLGSDEDFSGEEGGFARVGDDADFSADEAGAGSDALEV